MKSLTLSQLLTEADISNYPIPSAKKDGGKMYLLKTHRQELEKCMNSI